MQTQAGARTTLNVTLLTTSFPRFSGDAAGRFVYESALNLAARGMEVRVLAPHGPGITPEPPSSRLRVHHFRYFYPARFETLAYSGGIPSRLAANPLRAFLLPVFMVSFFLSALRLARGADVMHAFWTPSALVALLVKAVTGVPVVITLWGSDSRLTRLPVFSACLRWCLNRADAIVSESSHFKQTLVDFGLPAQKIFVIANGLDTGRFQTTPRLEARKKLGLAEEDFVFLSVGSCTPVKGHRYLIEAAPRILEQASAARFILIGDGESRAALEELAKRHGIGHRFLFAGWRDPGDIPLWLDAADAFLHPSLSEGNPNAVLEAMAAGLPILATRVGGLGEMISDGENGFLVPPGSAAPLAEKALLLMRDEALRQSLGERARRWVEEEHHSWHVQAGCVAEVYARLSGAPAQAEKAAHS